MARVVVLGGGESGVGAALLAQKLGEEVMLSDAGFISEKRKSVLSHHNILFEEGGHSDETLQSAELVIKSPGIPRGIKVIQDFISRGVEVIGEVEYAWRHSNSKFVAITGSNGKTTTTMLVHHILKNADLNVAMAGNIGESIAALMAKDQHPEWVVLEVSSFQLDDAPTFSPEVAILLNITEDHLDRYDHDIQKYARSKMQIAANQQPGHCFIYNEDDPMIQAMLEAVKVQSVRIPFSIQNNHASLAACTQDGELIIRDLDKKTKNINPNNPLTMTIQELALQGKHNLYNSMASGIAGRILEVRKDLIRECLTDFQNIEHRLEHVNTVYGMDFINDSKATNVNSAWYALESMASPVIWIAGGVDKGNDYSQIVDMVKHKVKAIVCLGKDNSKLIEAFGEHIPLITETTTMRDAVYAAYKFGEKGDAVLLSPACASFDLFEDYEDRGRQFKEAVRNL